MNLPHSLDWVICLGITHLVKKDRINFLRQRITLVWPWLMGDELIRKNITDANIGTTFSCSHIDPYRDGPTNAYKDLAAVQRMDAL